MIRVFLSETPEVKQVQGTFLRHIKAQAWLRLSSASAQALLRFGSGSARAWLGLGSGSKKRLVLSQ